MHLGPLSHFHNTVMERSRPMSEFPVARDHCFSLDHTFEIKLNILFLSLVTERRPTSRKLTVFVVYLK